MSTKIYNAYALKFGVDLWTFAEDVRRTALERVQNVLRTAYRELVDMTVSPLQLTERRGGMPLGRQPNYGAASRLILDEYRAQLLDGYVNTFDLDVSVAFYRVSEGPRMGTVLLRAFSGSGMLSDCLGFLSGDSRVADFHYQNSTDRPKDVDEDDWERRRVTWDHVLPRARIHKTKLELVLVSPGMWFDIDPAYDMRLSSDSMGQST